MTVEVVSPAETATALDRKVQDYLDAGVRLIWVVYPNTHRLMFYRPGHSPLRLVIDDEISGFDVLPGFSCHVRDFFPS